MTELGDTDVVEAVAPPLPPKPRRLTVADRWNAMDIQGRLDVLCDMERKQILPPGVLMREYYDKWDALDMRFGNLLFDIQELVEAYLLKQGGEKCPTL